LLADEVEGYDQEQLLNDIDAWGYSFRMVSAHRRFTHYAEEVQKWLIDHNILNIHGELTWNLRA
jgi:hypothetical protein